MYIRYLIHMAEAFSCLNWDQFHRCELSKDIYSLTLPNLWMRCSFQQSDNSSPTATIPTHIFRLINMHHSIHKRSSTAGTVDQESLSGGYSLIPPRHGETRLYGLQFTPVSSRTPHNTGYDHVLTIHIDQVALPLLKTILFQWNILVSLLT